MIDTIRDWLAAVGAVYHITEVHHVRRADSRRRPGNQWFEFTLGSSRLEKPLSGSRVVVAETNDVVCIEGGEFVRDVSVVVRGREDGLDVLDALWLSAKHPHVSSLLTEGRVVPLSYSGAVDETKYDDREIQYAHRGTYVVRGHVDFVATRADMIFDTMRLSGSLAADNGDTIEVAIEDDVT